MAQFTAEDGTVFSARDQQDGVFIDPELPANFDDTPNERRPPGHMMWWGVPYIRTESVEAMDAHYARLDGRSEKAREHWTREGRLQWMVAWPSGTRYEVRCLDGGAWDRSTCWGMFASVEEALRCVRGGGPAWRVAPKVES